MGRYMKSPLSSSCSLNLAKIQGVSCSKLLSTKLSCTDRIKAFSPFTHLSFGNLSLYIHIVRYTLADARFFLPVQRSIPWLPFDGALKWSGMVHSLCGGVISLSFLNNESDLNGLPEPLLFAVYFPRSLAMRRMILSSVANEDKLSNCESCIVKKNCPLSFLIDGLGTSLRQTGYL